MTDATRMIAADLARDMDRTGPWPRSRRVENAVRREDHERAVRNKRIAARHGENGRTLQLVNVNPKAAA